MGRKDRSSERFKRRLETEFFDGKETRRGISSDFSDMGLFIRTKHGLAPGSVLDITIYLPDGKVSKMKGAVKRTIKMDSIVVKNGMGILILEKDGNYADFVKTQTGEILIITCKKCLTKNRVPSDKLYLGPKCGKCKSPLETD
jgi:hypothetical protein